MPETVLLVEDDPDEREVVRSALAAAGYTVLVAVHGAEGVHLARRHEPGLILMDLRMPLMDGRASLRYIRADPATRHLPVWAISGFLEDEAAEAGSELQFDRLLSKPMTADVLVAAVREYLGGSGPGQEVKR